MVPSLPIPHPHVFENFSRQSRQRITDVQLKLTKYSTMCHSLGTENAELNKHNSNLSAENETLREQVLQFQQQPHQCQRSWLSGVGPFL